MARPPGILPRRKALGHPPSEEYWKAKGRAKWQVRYKREGKTRNEERKTRRKTDPEWRDKELRRSRESYLKNKEAYAARKLRWTRENREHYRAQWKAWYDSVKHEKRKEQLANRKKYRPLYGLKRALDDLERGIIGFDEFNGLVDKSLARLDDFSRRRTDRKEPRTSLGQGQCIGRDSNSEHSQGTPQVDEIEVRHRKGSA
jgi:hypothetical protein